MNVYEIITESICEKLEAGTVPWKQPWSSPGESVMNAITKKAYRGINIFLLSASGYGSPYWLTLKQAASRGGNVKAGEKGSPIVFWKREPYQRENPKTGETEEAMGFLLRYYTVFNTDQCEGLELVSLPRTRQDNAIDSIETCERVVSEMPTAPVIQHSQDRAFYSPSQDKVNIPPKRLFSEAPKYYSTIFHELTHSTGHESRLNRHGDNSTDFHFACESYSKEELVAEMGAAFLCGQCGIEPTTLDNSAAYIASWLKQLRKDKKLVIIAAAQAQKAADFILNRKVAEYAKAA